MYNQGNYQQYGQRLPPPPPLQPPAPVTPFQHMSPPIPPPAHRIAPNMPPPPPHTQGQHFYRVPAPPLLPGGIHGIQLPPPPTSYFTPAPFGSLGLLPPPPPPPPPSSPPPGPPPLPPSSPPPNPPHSPSSESLSTDAELNPSNDTSRHDDSLNCTAVHGFEMRVKDFNTPAPPLKPRDEKTVRKIEVLCQYIAKNGHEFENMTCQKEVDNPEFKFLFGGSPGSEAAISHEYFKWMKKKCSSSALLDEGHNRDMSLLSNSPAGSDMDMEDDITQPGELGVSSPIKLIQGYASDDSSDDGDDDELHFENVSPVANDDELHFENVSPVAVSPYGIIESKDSLKEDDLKEDLEKETDSYLMREKVKEEGDDSGCHKHGKLEVDEFGRMVKAGGGSESESDENTRRRGKRGRSRSRSRSPNGRRRRSPWRRRREERSRSRSWSPKKRSRSRSRSPYRHRDREEAGADWTRRNKNQLEVCYDFRRGRCFRGSTCRFFHDSEESRWHKNKQHNKDEVDTHEDTQLYQENINTNNDTISQEFVDPQITKTHENSEIYPPYQPPLSSSEHPQPSSLPPPTWNHHLPLPLPLPPPPPRPLLQYPPPLQYPFQAFHPPAGIPVSLYTSQTHYNPYASTFNQPLPTNFSSGTSYTQYDPLFDSIEEKNTKVKESAIENDEFGETGDVENESPISPIDLPDVATGEVEIDQAPKVKKPKDCRSMKLFKVAVAEFVKEVLKPSWRQGNMSKEAFKTIVKKTVDKVSGAMKKHQLPKSQAKINQYIDSSQRKLTKLVMGYVDKYVKV